MGLKENLAQETVKSLPLREAIVVTAETTVAMAVERMREKRLGCSIVVDSANKPIGTFTERMLMELLLKESVQLDATPVCQCLDKDWFTIQETAPIQDVMDLIRNRAARFICVTDEAGSVVGVTGQKGLSEYIADHFPQQVMVQRIGGKPGLKTREGA